MNISGNSPPELPTVLVLSGGIGGAKLALGLVNVLAPEKLMIVGNIGDDFVHFGQHISPDLDTLMYTLSGTTDTEIGCGLANESWNFMQALKKLSGTSGACDETWFQLGDQDLATHLERTRRLAKGETLSEITTDFCRKFGIEARIIPASNDETPEGDLAFQNYFVQKRCEPIVSGLRFQGAENALPTPEFMEMFRNQLLQAVVICPSNPILSIDPILAICGVREALRECSAPVIAVSPIVGGDAVKGPTAKIMRELGHPVSATAVANYYCDFLDGFIVDFQDEAEIPGIQKMDVSVEATETLMTDLETKTVLANTVMDFSRHCGNRTFISQKNGL